MTATASLDTQLGIEHPIIQAPMAGSTTPALVAAVSNAGGLGMLGAAYLTPDQIDAAIRSTRELTDRPFGINLFAGGRARSTDVDPQPALAVLSPFYEQLGLPAPPGPSLAPDLFDAQLEAVLAANVPIFSFTFGIPDRQALSALKSHDVIVMGTATTVDEAKQLEAAGVNAIVAQGSEAGAHRGTFAAPFEAAMIGTMALVPQVVDAVRLPVVASGGIMDGRGIVAAEALGAQAVQMGTAFLTCEEAGIPQAYKEALRVARAEETALTRAYSGRPARAIVNDFIRAWDGREDTILPFPLQNSLTRPLRNAAADQSDTRLLALWAGQGASLARAGTAGDLVRRLVEERNDVRARLGADQ